ncbi:WD40 repeat-like protein [Agrocybe pediades]|nr:WD40 repeat-like protein [Agrocybe pediades]
MKPSAAPAHAPIPHHHPTDDADSVLAQPTSPSPPAMTPTPGRQSPGEDRRETILNLVEMLLKNNGGGGVGLSGEHCNGQTQFFEDDKDVPSVDEHLQVVGAEVFHKLQRRINNLDKELRNFANAARQLGSSVAILSSAFHLRERLAQLLFLYHENAADLFPRKVQHIVRGDVNIESPVNAKRRRGFRRVKGKAQLHVPRPTVSENLDPEMFPEQLEALAKEVTTFLKCLNEFPEFTDEAVNTSILSFEGDLKYWASCLKEYQAGQFRYPAVQRYIHDLSAEMGTHIDELTSSLSMFIEVGVPTIRFAQKHGAENLLNLSTVATFFSAVTATTMQFSYELERTTISDSVNSFWFASLVFSIGAAVNSLLGLTWKQAMYRSPGHRVPWWVLIWIKRSPLVLLVLSVACFSVGLCCFAYASHQAPVTSTITTVLTTFTSFGLAAVSAWFASERWTFSRHKGQKWLSDVLNEATDRFFELPGVTYAQHILQAAMKSARKQAAKFRKVVVKASRGFVSYWLRWKCDAQCLGKLGCGSGHDDDDDLEANRLPTTMPPPTDQEKRALSPEPAVGASMSFRPSDATAVMSEPSLPGSPITLAPTPVNSPVDNDFSLALNAGGPPLLTASQTATTTPPTQNAAPTLGKQLWKNAVRNVKMRNSALNNNPLLGGSTPTRGTGMPMVRAEPVRKRTMSSSVSIAGPGSIGKRSLIGPAYTRSRVSELVPRLIELEVTHDLAAHSALVRHMQFSPDGKYLATSSWDKTAVIFQVGRPFIPHRTLAHAQGFVGQVAWSPTGKLLLTKMARGVKVWTAEVYIFSAFQQVIDPTFCCAQDGVCKKTINRNVSIESVTWFPDGNSFLSIEESVATKLHLYFISIQVLEQYDFGSMKLHDVAVTPDGLRLVGVGPLLRSPTGLQPSKSRVEKRLVVYNVETKQIENLTPVLEDVRDITIAQTSGSGLVALVSYEHEAPPQLWKLELVKDRENNKIITSRLSLRHTYMPKGHVDFSGSSYFGGVNNELVLSGDIHIWDQESGAHLHSIRAQAHGGDLTCIAWNHPATNPFMFATGSHDGGVRIWTRLEPDDDMDDDAEPTPKGMSEFPRSSSPDQLDAFSASTGSLDDDFHLRRSRTEESGSEDHNFNSRRVRHRYGTPLGSESENHFHFGERNA